MVTIKLESQHEKLAPDTPFGLRRRPLYHQMRTWDALQRFDLVMNTYNTGTGKTWASLFYLFTLNSSGKNVLFIAPTNALLAQHATDIEQFIASNNLDFKVLRVSAAEIRAIESNRRPGETLQQLIRNYLEFDPVATRRQPIILVINPDIFYYALYFRYGIHDRRNIFERFLTAFDYIVVDEFHYYDAKQFANFLFAFALFDQFGYFDVRERKICLLSATPSQTVVAYLDGLFGSRWTRVGPDNEPPEAALLDTIPALTSLDLSVSDGDVSDWVVNHRQLLVDWIVRKALDGALISNSLARINSAYAVLRSVLANERIGRITGPEPEERRTEATECSLVLATPTVDIGYNFTKRNKVRQNVDFVVCDAHFGDELLQRLGRAGRVLGKEETTIPSRGLAVLPPDAVAALSVYDGQTLTRPEFAQVVKMCSHLPPKHSFTGYIRSHAISECFWPIYQIGKVIPVDLQDEMEALFDRVCEVFAPGSQRSRGGLKGFFRKLESRERWLEETKREQIRYDRYTAEHVADWLAWLAPEEGRYSPADLQQHLSRLLNNEAQRRDLRSFVESQVAITKALFAFRDSFQGPTAVIYDPQYQFSTQAVNAYDLFHLVRNYHLSLPMTRQQFIQHCASTDLKGDFYLHLLGQRVSPLMLEFVYTSEDERSVFERKWCGAPVALRGFRLQARERGGDVLAGALDSQIVAAVTETYLPTLIIPPDDVGAMISRLRGSSLWPQRLSVCWPDGTIEEDYRAFLGTAAFHAHAELQGHFLLKDRLRSDAIII